MSKVTLTKGLSRNGTIFDSSVSFALQTMVVETAIVAAKSVALLFMMMGTLPNGIDVFIKEDEAYTGFPLAQLVPMTKPGPENKDVSDAEDDDDDDDEEEEEAADDDQDEDGGEEEDGSGEEGGDREDEPEANGDADSGGEDDEDDDDDDDDDGEEEEEDEEEEELQPPAKKRK